MANENKDIIRVEATEANLQSTLIAGQLGFTTDSYKMGHLMKDGVTMKWWSPDSSDWFYVDGSNNIGVYTTTPAAKFDIHTSNNDKLVLSDPDDSTGNHIYQKFIADGTLKFLTGYTNGGATNNSYYSIVNDSNVGLNVFENGKIAYNETTSQTNDFHIAGSFEVEDGCTYQDTSEFEKEGTVIKVTSSLGKVILGSSSDADFMLDIQKDPSDVITSSTDNAGVPVRLKGDSNTANEGTGILFENNGTWYDTKGIIGVVSNGFGENGGDMVLCVYRDSVSSWNEIMRLTHDQKVGINTQTPLGTLQVNGTIVQFNTSASATNKFWKQTLQSAGWYIATGSDDGTSEQLAYNITRSGLNINTHTWYINTSSVMTLNNSNNLVLEGDYIGKADDTSNLGSSSNRFANLYMASTIDYSSDLNFASSGNKLKFTTAGKVRANSADYRRYYHLPLFAANPGVSGATWTQANANHINGWQLDNVNETLEFNSDVHSDWDGASDLEVEVYFQLLDAGSNNDTVDLRLQCYYIGTGETSTKSQTVEVSTITDGTQYKMYKATFMIDYDAASNIVEAGDKFGFILNLETDTSEIDNVLITDAAFYYNTTHVGIEDGDI